MARCEVCENDYDKSFQVMIGNQAHTFDSFECAIHALAPVCPNCGIKVVGHGVESSSGIFCCVNCSKMAGVQGLKDRL